MRGNRGKAPPKPAIEERGVLAPRFIARVCVACGKPGGTISQRFVAEGVWKRDYFHNKCFKGYINAKR